MPKDIASLKMERVIEAYGYFSEMRQKTGRIILNRDIHSAKAFKMARLLLNEGYLTTVPRNFHPDEPRYMFTESGEKLGEVYLILTKAIIYRS
ncbi:MAG: hypothetical protein WAV16_04170 [Candidatus Moraniibacteriota bacterium]